MGALVLFAALQARAATIGVPENLPPWGLDAAQPVGQRGIYADLADALAARVHVPTEIRFVPYGRMLQQVKSGEVDYAFGAVSPATSAAAPFTAIVGKMPMVAVARKGLSLKTLTDLHGFTRSATCAAAVARLWSMRTRPSSASPRTATTARSASWRRAVLTAGAAPSPASSMPSAN
jgi:ABC-type amino acid transport substrate-binding protein